MHIDTPANNTLTLNVNEVNRNIAVGYSTHYGQLLSDEKITPGQYDQLMSRIPKGEGLTVHVREDLIPHMARWIGRTEPIGQKDSICQEMVKRGKDGYILVPTKVNYNKHGQIMGVKYGTIRDSEFHTPLGVSKRSSRGILLSRNHNMRGMLHRYLSTEEGQEYLAKCEKDGKSLDITHTAAGNFNGDIMGYYIDPETGESVFFVNENYMKQIERLGASLGTDKEGMLELALMEELAHKYGNCLSANWKKEERRAKGRVYDFVAAKSKSSDISVANKYTKLAEAAREELKSFVKRYEPTHDCADLEEHAAALFESYLLKAERDGKNEEEAIAYATKKTEEDLEEGAESDLEEKVAEAEAEDNGEEGDNPNDDDTISYAEAVAEQEAAEAEAETMDDAA